MFIPKCHHLQVKTSNAPFLNPILNVGSKSKIFQQLDIRVLTFHDFLAMIFQSGMMTKLSTFHHISVGGW